MRITLHRFVPSDAAEFLHVHHAAVRGTAAADYPASVIDGWAPEIRPEDIARVAGEEGTVRNLARDGAQVVGIGEVVPDLNELRACYVLPEVGRSGVGR